NAETAGRMRIAFGELALRLGSQGLGSRLSPGDEEALLGGHAVAGRNGVRLSRQGPGERPVREPHAAEIADGFALDPLAVEAQAVEGGVRAGDAGGARFELRAIGLVPPAGGPPAVVELGTAGVEGVGEIVGDSDADAAVELRVAGVGPVADGQEEAGRQDDLV